MKGRTDLGHVTVKGLILVPYPPTKIKAFIIFRLISDKLMDLYFKTIFNHVLSFMKKYQSKIILIENIINLNLNTIFQQ